jgi:hypothetical protein
MTRIRHQALASFAILSLAGSAYAQDAEPESPAPAQPAVVVAETPQEVPAPVEYAEPQVVTKAEVQKTAADLVPALPNPTLETSQTNDVTDAWNSNLEEFEKRYQWRLQVGGYIRTVFSSIQDDPDTDIYGRNDGFMLANARLTLAGDMRNSLGFRFQIDGAVDRNVSDATRPVSEIETRLKDALLWWKPIPQIRITAGQFKPPFDAEEQYSRADQLFIDNSVGNQGVHGSDGYNVDGLSRDREAGVMLDSDTIFFNQKDGFGVRYAVAATNGSSATLSQNDNSKLAYYGRLEAHYDEMVRIGGAGYVNSETLLPEAADQIERDVFGWTADLTLNAAGVTVLGSMTQTTYTYGGIAIEPEVTAMAYQASIAYQEPFFGFQPTFRYAFLDPSSSTSGQTTDLLFDADERTFYTLGLNYNPRYPIRVMVNYTITAEGEAVALDNNRFDAMLQLSW